MKLKVNGQSLELEGGNIIAEGSVGFASFTLECDSSWKGYSRTVRFRHASQEKVYDVAGVVDNDVYYIPAEVLVRGSVFVSVLGVKGTANISTTEFAGFFVEGTVDSGMTPTVTENAYAQYVSMVNEKVELVNEAAALAENSREHAEQLAGLAAISEDHCRESASLCLSRATYCQEAVGRVAGAEREMNIAVEQVHNSVNSLLSHDHALSVAENGRVASENARAEAERVRGISEKERELAEKARVEAEAERIAAERGRVAGEAEREKRIAQAEDGIDSVSKALYTTAAAIRGEMEGEKIIIDDAEEKRPMRLDISGITLQETSPSRAHPCDIITTADTGSVEFSHMGKNLITYPYYFTRDIDNYGVLYKIRSDGGFFAKGETTTLKSMIELVDPCIILDAGDYVVSGGTKECGVMIYNWDTYQYIAVSNGGDAEFTLTEPARIKVRIYVYANTVVPETIIYPMVRYRNTSKEFETYYKRSYTLASPCPLYSVDGESGKFSDKLVLFDWGKEARVEKRLTEYIADGTETVTLVEQTEDGHNLFLLNSPHIATAKEFLEGKYEGMGYCTHLPYSDTVEGERCFVKEDTIYLKLDKSEFSDEGTVSSFLAKCYADGTPLKVVYVATETTEESYEHGVDLKLREGANSLSSDSAKVNFEYIRNTNTVFESIIDTLVELDARVSLLEV